MCRLVALFGCNGNGFKVQVCWYKKLGFILLHMLIKIMKGNGIRIFLYPTLYLHTLVYKF